MRTITVKHDDTVPSEKGHYRGVHVVLNFNRNYGVNRKEDQADVDPYPDEEEMESVRLDN